MDAETIQAIAQLAWPVLAAFVAIYLLPTIERLAKSRSFTIKVGEFEISVQEAAEQAERQIEDLQKQVQQQPGAAAQTFRVDKQAAVPAAATRRSLLWVDDAPQTKAYEITKLRNDGWEVSTVGSTAEALERIAARPPTAIVAAMSRGKASQDRCTADLGLVRDAKAKSYPPVIVFTTAQVSAFGESIRELGSRTIASPIELFRALDSIGR